MTYLQHLTANKPESETGIVTAWLHAVANRSLTTPTLTSWISNHHIRQYMAPRKKSLKRFEHENESRLTRGAPRQRIRSAQNILSELK